MQKNNLTALCSKNLDFSVGQPLRQQLGENSISLNLENNKQTKAIYQLDGDIDLIVNGNFRLIVRDHILLNNVQAGTVDTKCTIPETPFALWINTEIDSNGLPIMKTIQKKSDWCSYKNRCSTEKIAKRLKKKKVANCSGDCSGCKNC